MSVWRMRRFALCLIAAAGCSTSPDATVDTAPDEPSEPPIPAGKEDAPTTCGYHGETCDAALCGAEYASSAYVPGTMSWRRSCEESDGSATTYSHFSIRGDVEAEHDSRMLPAGPVAFNATSQEIDNATAVGCTVLPESTPLAGPGDGVTIYFSEWKHFSWTGMSEDQRGRSAYVQTNRLVGPGKYRGYGGYLAADGTQYGGYLDSRDCEINITTDAANALSGTIKCSFEVMHDRARKIDMTGDFKCSASTLRTGVWKDTPTL